MQSYVLTLANASPYSNCRPFLQPSPLPILASCSAYIYRRWPKWNGGKNVLASACFCHTGQIGQIGRNFKIADFIAIIRPLKLAKMERCFPILASAIGQNVLASVYVRFGYLFLIGTTNFSANESPTITSSPYLLQSAQSAAIRRGSAASRNRE